MARPLTNHRKTSSSLAQAQGAARGRAPLTGRREIPSYSWRNASPSPNDSRVRPAPRSSPTAPPPARTAGPGTAPDRPALLHNGAAVSERVSAAEPANPMAMPVSAIRKPFPATIWSTSAEGAPLAMRMPNFPRALAYRNASTPKTPMSASTKASAPNDPTSCARKRGCVMDCIVRTRGNRLFFVPAQWRPSLRSARSAGHDRNRCE